MIHCIPTTLNVIKHVSSQKHFDKAAAGSLPSSPGGAWQHFYTIDPSYCGRSPDAPSLHPLLVKSRGRAVHTVLSPYTVYLTPDKSVPEAILGNSAPSECLFKLTKS